nr:MAG TPA: hypothetical protein [Caudoviricetes sp.]
MCEINSIRVKELRFSSVALFIPSESLPFTAVHPQSKRAIIVR